LIFRDGAPNAAALAGIILFDRSTRRTDHGHKDGPELLSSINSTFTGVWLAQRIPVGIHLTGVPPGVLISTGMTCTVVIKEGSAPENGLGIKKA
jgi:multidrug resistance efflux pump